MVRRSTVAAAVVVAALLGACSSGDDDSTEAAGPRGTGSVAAASAPAPSPTTDDGGGGGAIDVMAGAPGEAGAAACDLTRQTLQMAADAYLAMAGEPPAGQSDLLGEGLIREESPWFELSDQGEVVPAPGSPCS